jgi:MYXO-CTERM domain-containing protein
MSLSRGTHLAIALACLFGATPVWALPGYCSNATATEGIAVGDTTYEGANADDCYGVVAGNINSAADINGLSLSWGTDWILLGTDNVPPVGGEAGNTGTYLGLSMIVTADVGTSGDWLLSATDTNGATDLNLPATMDFAVALKAGNEYALWFFDDVTVNAVNDGAWEIVFLNNGGQVPDLSHLTLFVRDGTTVTMPEPGGLALLGLGALAAWSLRRRTL